MNRLEVSPDIFPDPPRQCPICNVVAHYAELRSLPRGKTVELTCPWCGYQWLESRFKKRLIS